MDNTFKKSDISKRILETRKQTEELKAQLQNLIDTGINSSLEYKSTLHSHLDKENIKESENKVQIIKSYDTKHSQHITKPSSSRINLPETLNHIKLENQQKNSKKARNYDVNEARDYIKKQKEKRLEQQKLQNEEKKKAEIKKQKLQELHKKSLELVAKNVQVKRERSKSRERIDFVRPVKDIPRSRSSSQEKGINRHKPDLNDNYGRRGKSVERSRNIPLENVGPINPNLLYPPIPTHLLKIQEQKTRTTNKKSPASHNKIVILSGNSTDKKTESPNSDVKNETELLKPKNLFNCSKNTNTLYPPSQSYELNAQMQVTNSSKSPNSDLKSETELLKPKDICNISKNVDTSYLPPKTTEFNTRIQTSNSSKDEEKIDIANKNSSNSFHKTAISSNNSAAGKTKSRKLDYNTKQKISSPKDVEVSHLTNGKFPLEIESNNNCTSVNNILNYKSTHNKNSSNINLHFPDNVNLTTRNHNNSAKPNGTSNSETVIDAYNLEKFTKETQTNDEPKHEFPLWLQEKRFESNPLNFINTVKRKLHYAINSPKTHVDVGVQSSIAQQNFKPDAQNIKSKEEILDILQHSAKSSKRSDLKSFISHKCLNLDKKTIDNIELIPNNFSSRHLISSKNTETESESDTSKNIPEISSESGTSLNKNAESVKQNGGVGLDVERLTSLKLRAHNVDKNTHTIHSGEIQTEATAHPYSIVINDKSPIKMNFDDAVNTKTETKRSVSKIHENDQYTSDFQSSSRSISTHSSLMQNKTSINSSKSAGYQNLMDPQVMLYSEKHSNNIPKESERHSNNTTTNIKTNSEKFVSSRNITIRNNSLGKNISHTSIQSNNSRDISTNKKTISNDTSIVTESESETQGSKNKSEKYQPSESITSIGSSKKSDEYKSLYSDFHPSVTVNEMLSKSDSNLQYINTRRGSHLSSENSKFINILPLKEPTLSLVVANEKITQKANKNEDSGKLFKNIPLKSATNKFADQNNTNEIHLKFEAEIHLLNDFNESLRQFSEVEKAFNSLKSKNDTSGAANKILHNQDTQTSIITKSSSTSKATENTDSDKSQLSSINFSRFLINADSSSLNDTAVSKLDETNNAEDVLNININQDLCNFENLQSHNFAGMTLRMFEQLIKDEDVRLENLKTILKIREQALLDRTKGELAWLEIQRKHLRETGKLHEASLIKKKQRGILVNHQKERHEMQRLKQMQKAASIERKIILKEQRNLIKNQLSTDKMLSKIKVNTPRERRLSGPLKVIQSHTESIRSETSFSRRSSSEKEKETYSVMSHTQSIVSMVSEVSGEEVTQKDGTSRADATDLVIKLPSEAGGVPISQMKRTLLIREVALQKRRKAALELLQWHRKLLEEEKRITELESTANTIISQIPNNAPASPDAAEKYQFRGKQLNQLWFNLTGCNEKKFSENKIYPMSQIALERFCKSAREYSSKTKAPKQLSDSEVSEYSVMRTDDSLSENIPDRKVTHSASIRTESELSQRSSNKIESVPVTTANDYTSDFDIESLQDVVNIEDVNVVDRSINQLIDNFNKIQDDISSLSIKQSLMSDIELELDESIRSEKSDSEVEISVIETAKTSKERSFEEADSKLVENNKIVNSSQTLSTSEDINDSYNNLADINTANERSKSTEDKIGTEMPDLVSSSEVPSAGENKDAKLELDQSNNKSTYDKVSSIIEENALNIEGKNNLNTSKEILEELSYLESQINEDLPPDAIEDIEIIYKAKDNLSKTEEILSRLSQSEPKHSIISSREDEYPLESEKVSLDKNSATESEGVLLNLRPLENKVSDDVPSASVLSKQDTELSEDERSVISDTSENLLSKKTPVTEDNIVENTESKDEHIVLNEEKIDLSSEIKSETPIPTEGSSRTRETSEKSSGQAVDEISESQKILSVLQDEFVISNENQNKGDDKSKSVFGSNNLQLEQSKSEEVSKVSQEDQDITSEKEKESLHSLPIEEIFEVVEERTDIDERLLTDKNTESVSYTKPLEEDVTEIKDEISDKDKPSNSFKDTENYEENDTQEKVTDLSSNKESEIITEASEKDLEENIESKSSDRKILLEKSLIEPQSEKHTEEENAEDVVSQQTVPDIIPSVIEETDKSQVTSVPENLATLLSKEDINSFEEKELDSLSSSTTGSQSSMPSEREESQFSEKSKTSSSDEKSPRSGTVDVKKRVSEIMADANQGSRGDKSPKLQDFYTTTYDLVSPANSPELGSPTEEHKYITAKSIFGTEAEEILRKQLAIEQEIKQITEQQQKEQLPYLFVREIPNKPPPPYTPPTSVPAANVITIIPTSDEIENITKYSAKILHKAYLSKNLDNISISENTLSLISKDITKECYKFVFDLCKEISKEHYKQFEKEECLAWLQVKKNPRLAVVKPLDVTGLEKHMSKKLKELFGYEKPVRRENAIIKWSRKKRDHVDEILVMESQAEETQWTNYDKDELLVMNEVTNEIMNMLLKETGEVFSKILSKQTF